KIIAAALRFVAREDNPRTIAPVLHAPVHVLHPSLVQAACMHRPGISELPASPVAPPRPSQDLPRPLAAFSAETESAPAINSLDSDRGSVPGKRPNAAWPPARDLSAHTPRPTKIGHRPTSGPLLQPLQTQARPLPISRFQRAPDQVRSGPFHSQVAAWLPSATQKLHPDNSSIAPERFQIACSQSAFPGAARELASTTELPPHNERPPHRTSRHGGGSPLRSLLSDQRQSDSCLHSRNYCRCRRTLTLPASASVQDQASRDQLRFDWSFLESLSVGRQAYPPLPLSLARDSVQHSHQSIGYKARVPVPECRDTSPSAALSANSSQ